MAVILDLACIEWSCSSGAMRKRVARIYLEWPVATTTMEEAVRGELRRLYAHVLLV